MRRYAELAAVWHHASADAPDVAEARAGAEGAVVAIDATILTTYVADLARRV